MNVGDMEQIPSDINRFTRTVVADTATERLKTLRFSYPAVSEGTSRVFSKRKNYWQMGTSPNR